MAPLTELGGHYGIHSISFNRKHAYLDDPMWLINKACLNTTGCNLPDGFYTLDWSYKVDPDSGKKIAKRTLPQALMKDPLLSHSFINIEQGFFRTNLYSELNIIFTGKFRHYYAPHLKFAIYEGFVRFLKDRDIKLRRPDTYNDDETFTLWWDTYSADWRATLFTDPNSKVSITFSSSLLRWLAQTSYHYFCYNADLVQLQSLPDPSHILTNGEGYCVPRWITRDKNPLQDCQGDRNLRYNDIKITNQPSTYRRKNECRETFNSIRPILMYGAHDNPPMVQTITTLFYIKSGKVDYDDIPNSLNRIRDLQKEVNKRKGRIKDHRSNERKHNYYECDTMSKVKVKKTTWVPWFWYRVNDITTTTFQLGELGEIVKRGMRKNSWDHIKQDSGLIGEFEDYYKHRGGQIYPFGDQAQKGYEKNFKASLSKELFNL